MRGEGGERGGEERKIKERRADGNRKSVLAPKKGAKVIAPKRKGLVDQKRVTKVFSILFI